MVWVDPFFFTSKQEILCCRFHQLRGVRHSLLLRALCMPGVWLQLVRLYLNESAVIMAVGNSHGPVLEASAGHGLSLHNMWLLGGGGPGSEKLVPSQSVLGGTSEPTSDSLGWGRWAAWRLKQLHASCTADSCFLLSQTQGGRGSSHHGSRDCLLSLTMGGNWIGFPAPKPGISHWEPSRTFGE